MKAISTIICAALLTASLTLTVGAVDAEQIDTREEITGEIVEIEEAAATEGQIDKGSADAAESAEAETIGAEVETEANGEKKDEKKDTGTLTEQELYDAIMKVADAVGAYEEEIPAAGKAKEWIIRNLPTIVGLLMSLAVFIVTPAGKKMFARALTAAKSIMETIEKWKKQIEKAIAENGEKNSQLRTAVNEMMSVLKRENEEALKRAEAAEARAAENADEAEKTRAEAKAAYEQCAAACEAVCRAVLAMATPLETTIQKSSALDKMQKDQFYEEYKKTVNHIHGLLDGMTEGGESGD